MKTIIYGGHLSRFGRAFIKEILANGFFKVEAIVLADYKRWVTFQRALARMKQLPDESTFKSQYHHYLKEIRAIIPTIIRINIVSDVNSVSALQTLQSFDVVLTAAFPQIFSTEFIQAAGKRAINFHPSYLPRCRGANPIYWAIAKREPFGGLTSHFITERIDSGPIIARRKIEYKRNEITYNELYGKVLATLPKIIEDTVDFFQKNKQPLDQNESEATFYKNNIKIDHKIHWSEETSSQILAKIRAGWAYTHLSTGRELILVTPAEFHQNLPRFTGNETAKIPPGCILHIEKHQVWIKSKDGYLQVHFKFSRQLADIYGWVLEKVGLGKWRSKMTLLSSGILKIGEILH